MRPGPEMSAGMMPALDWPGLIEPGAVRADQAGGSRLLGVAEELGRVLDGDPLGDDDGQGHLGVDDLDDGRLGERGRDEDHRDVGPGLRHRVRDTSEHRHLYAAGEVDRASRPYAG